MGGIKNILLTGGNGFLGSHILKSLLQEGFSPLVLLRAKSDTWRIDDCFDLCERYYLNEEGTNLEELFEKHNIEGIIHTATEYGRQAILSRILKTNVIFPVELIEHGLKNGLKIFINTDSFFAKKQYQQTYLNQYTSSKRILEEQLKTLSEKMTIVNLRIEHVYGEHDSEQKFVTSILKQLLQQQGELLLTEGKQKRDLVYVKDVAQSYIQVLKQADKLSSFSEFEVGTGSSMSIKDFVSLISSLSGSKTALNFGALPARAGDIEDSFANTQALNDMGWFPAYSMEEAITNTIKIEKERFKI